MKKLVWRLGKLPSVDELRELVKDKIITQEEAREILFNHETEEDRDAKSLKDEIKFLREMVDNLTRNQPTKIVEVIKQYQPHYIKYDWYTPYNNIVYCASTSQGGNYSLSSITTTAGSNTQTLC